MTDSVSKVDIEIWIGSDRPVIWELVDDAGELFAIDPGADFSMVIRHGGVIKIEKLASDDDGLAIDLDLSRITYTPTVEESRLVTLGRVNPYEIEMHLDGEELPIAYGMVKGRGGVNTDV